MKISYFESLVNTTPEVVEFSSWREFRDFFTDSPHIVTETKSDVPLFSAATFKPGTTRANKNVEVIHAVLLDFDKLHYTDAEAVRIAAHESQIDHVMYSTYSHGPTFCFRLIFRVSRPVLPSEWKRVWSSLVADTGLEKYVDQACKDPSRAYYLPSCPPEEKPFALTGFNDGWPYDVDKALKNHVELPAVAQVAEHGVDRDELLAFITDLRKTDRRMAMKMTKLAQGKAYAAPGERDNTTWAICCKLAENYPRANPESVAALFQGSLADMDGFLTLAEVEDKFARAQAGTIERLEEEARKAKEERENQIRNTLGEEGAEYTHEQIEGWKKQYGTDHFWVVQYGDAYFLFLDGDYVGPYSASSLVPAARDILAPAPVSLAAPTKGGGYKYLTAPDIVNRYGTSVTKMVYSTRAEASYPDVRKRTFYRAACTPRKLEPEYNEQVDIWLRLLGGPSAELLLDWVAASMELGSPCAALYLEGLPGTGKTMLAEGLARLWSEYGPVPLDSAMSQFNVDMTRCPLVLADEGIPEDFRGRPRTKELRQIIQARVHPIRQKYVGETSLEGCIRVVLTANNTDLLDSNAHLTINDIRAITERILHVHAGPEAKAYLQGMDQAVLSEWVHGDGIARHALWLAENRKVNKNARFLVAGGDSAMANTLTVNSGLRGPVCDWIISYLLEPRKLAQTAFAYAVACKEGELFVSAKGVSLGWNMYTTNTNALGTTSIAKALDGLSTGTVNLKVHDMEVTYYKINTELLVAWAERAGVADGDTVRRLIKTN